MTICVVVSPASILSLQKLAIGPAMCQLLCNESMRVGLMVQKSEDEIERKTVNVSRRLVFDNFAPIDSSSAQCLLSQDRPAAGKMFPRLNMEKN